MHNSCRVFIMKITSYQTTIHKRQVGAGWGRWHCTVPPMGCAHTSQEDIALFPLPYIYGAHNSITNHLLDKNSRNVTEYQLVQLLHWAISELVRALISTTKHSVHLQCTRCIQCMYTLIYSMCASHFICMYMCMSTAVSCCCQACLAILFLDSFAVQLVKSLIQSYVIARDLTSCLPGIIVIFNKLNCKTIIVGMLKFLRRTCTCTPVSYGYLNTINGAF